MSFLIIKLESQPIKHFENFLFGTKLNFAASIQGQDIFKLEALEDLDMREPPIQRGNDRLGQTSQQRCSQIRSIGTLGSRAPISSWPISRQNQLKYLRVGRIIWEYGTPAEHLGPQFNQDITYRVALRSDYSDGLENFLGKSNTKKDEDTYRLKINWKQR